MYNPPQSFIFDPPSPYSPIDPHAHSESEDSDEFPPYTSRSGYEADSDWD